MLFRTKVLEDQRDSSRDEAKRFSEALVFQENINKQLLSKDNQAQSTIKNLSRQLGEFIRLVVSSFAFDSN